MGEARRRGALDSRAGRHWTADEDDQLKNLVACGWSARRIAGVLKRPIEGVYYRARRWGGIDALRHRLFAVRSGREMMALMRVGIKPLRLWVARGWLRAHRGYGKRSRNTARLKLLVSDEALDEFLACRDGWTTWEPAQIADADWRARAEELRAGAGGRWVRTDELSRQAGVLLRWAQVCARVWERTGVRPAIKVAERWYVWVGEDETPAALRGEIRLLLAQLRWLWAAVRWRHMVEGYGTQERSVGAVHGGPAGDDPAVRQPEGAGA